MILHGIYNNGQITILDKNLPKIKTEVEIKIKNKPWQRKVKRIKVKGKPVSDTIIEERYNE